MNSKERMRLKRLDKGMRPQLTKEEKQKIISMHEQWHTTAMIARKFERNWCTIYKLLRNNKQK